MTQLQPLHAWLLATFTPVPLRAVLCNLATIGVPFYIEIVRVCASSGQSIAMPAAQVFGSSKPQAFHAAMRPDRGKEGMNARLWASTQVWHSDEIRGAIV